MKQDLSDVPAYWIGQSWMRDANPICAHPMAFYFNFTAPENVRTGILEVTSSHAYVLWINGRYALAGPLRAYPKDRFLDRLEIGEFLISGTNHIAVLAMGPTGVTGYSCISRAGFFCRGRVFSDEREVDFGSGPDWKTREASWVSSHGFLTSLPVGTQEHWDLRVEPPSWRLGSCNDWEQAFLLGGVGTPPWKVIKPRPTPLIQRNPIVAQMVWAGLDDRAARQPELNLALMFDSKEMESVAVSPQASREQLCNASANIFLFDLTRTRSMRPVLKILEAGEDSKIEVYYDIERGDKPSCMRGFYSDQEGFSDSIALSGVQDSWEPIQPRGCRFITIRIVGNSPCRIFPQFLEAEYPYDHGAKFVCENEEIQRIWDISADTLRSTSTDVLVDTCARENVLWTFDACVTGKAAFHTFGDTTLWRYSLWLISCGIDEDGIPSSVVPSQESFMCMFDQAMRWVIACSDYYALTGDITLLHETKDSIHRFLSQCANRVTHDCVFVPPNFSWHWIDWAPLNRNANSLPVNALLITACKAAIRISAHIESLDLELVATKLADVLTDGVQCFYDRDLGLFRDHVKPGKLKEAENEFFYRYNGEDPLFSLHGNVLMAELDPTSQRSNGILSRLAGDLGDVDDEFRRFGPGWTDILLQPLVRSGHDEEVLSLVLKTYGRLIKGEYPTWGEHFRSEKYNTAHGWGAVVNTLIVEGFIGLRPVGAGWDRFEICVKAPWRFNYELETKQGIIRVKRDLSGVFFLGPLSTVALVDGIAYACTGEWQKIPQLVT